ncbi:zinc finger CCHC domain-containing protein 7 [Aplochiton taeniatus]
MDCSALSAACNTGSSHFIVGSGGPLSDLDQWEPFISIDPKVIEDLLAVEESLAQTNSTTVETATALAPVTFGQGLASCFPYEHFLVSANEWQDWKNNWKPIFTIDSHVVEKCSTLILTQAVNLTTIHLCVALPDCTLSVLLTRLHEGFRATGKRCFRAGGQKLASQIIVQLAISQLTLALQVCNLSGLFTKRHGNVVPIGQLLKAKTLSQWGLNHPISSRYFTPDQSLRCHNCNKTGHLAKSCSTPKRRPTCMLCGLQGHVQRSCLGPHCPSCGLPAHGQLSCPEPPIWSQHCHRCGLTGHLTDACPDTWRQYHQTTQKEVSPRPPTGHAHGRRRRPALCYNCSRRGHLGHECTGRRMVSGTFPSVPYVCHYDTLQDLLQQDTSIRTKARELQEKGFLLGPGRHTTLEPAGGSGEEQSAPANPSRRRSRSLELWAKEGQGKTWPERRRERREVKRLRREAQARREGGTSDHQTYPSQPHKHRESPPPPKKRRRKDDRKERWTKEHSGKRKKSREVERRAKRRVTKQEDLHPGGGLGPSDQRLLSPKQRVRHRRR